MGNRPPRAAGLVAGGELQRGLRGPVMPNEYLPVCCVCIYIWIAIPHSRGPDSGLVTVRVPSGPPSNFDGPAPPGTVRLQRHHDDSLACPRGRCLPRRGAEAHPSSSQGQSGAWVWAKGVPPWEPLAPARLASEDGGGAERPCRDQAPSWQSGNRVGVHLSREGIPALGSRL